MFRKTIPRLKKNKLLLSNKIGARLTIIISVQLQTLLIVRDDNSIVVRVR